MKMVPLAQPPPAPQSASARRRLRRGELRCRQCRAACPSDAYVCWACGTRLLPLPLQGRPVWMGPVALRHYSSEAVALGRASFVQGAAVLVLVVLFGVMAGTVLLEASPKWPPAIDVAGLVADPARTLLPGVFPREVANLPVGETFAAHAVVAQVAAPRLETIVGGRGAPQGRAFLVVTVVLHNQGSRPVTYFVSDWKTRDGNGRTYRPEPMVSPGWLSGGQIAPDQLVQADLAFLVPAGDPELTVRFEPRFARAKAATWAVAPEA